MRDAHLEASASGALRPAAGGNVLRRGASVTFDLPDADASSGDRMVLDLSVRDQRRPHEAHCARDDGLLLGLLVSRFWVE